MLISFETKQLYFIISITIILYYYSHLITQQFEKFYLYIHMKYFFIKPLFPPSSSLITLPFHIPFIYSSIFFFFFICVIYRYKKNESLRECIIYKNVASSRNSNEEKKWRRRKNMLGNNFLVSNFPQQRKP